MEGIDTGLDCPAGGKKKGKFRQDRRREPPVCERTPLGETATRTRPLGYGLSN
jgi:hypothetical protein